MKEIITAVTEGLKEVSKVASDGVKELPKWFNEEDSSKWVDNFVKADKPLWEQRIDLIENYRKKYLDDLTKNSEHPHTIDTESIQAKDLKKISPEENAKMRENFDRIKNQLKTEWAKLHNKPWPKYDKDVYSKNGHLIRKKGMDYDAHHITPLGIGGKNEARNITPMHADKHYDKQGVHSPSSPYDKLTKLIGDNYDN